MGLFLAKRMIVLALLFGVSGCVGVETRPVEDVVSERVGERWTLLMEGRFESVYDYFSPAYRQVIPVGIYVKRQAGNRLVTWLDAKVNSVNCQERLCEVKTMVTTELRHDRMQVPSVTTSPVIEKWILAEDGQWYYVPKN